MTREREGGSHQRLALCGCFLRNNPTKKEEGPWMDGWMDGGREGGMVEAEGEEEEKKKKEKKTKEKEKKK